MNPKPDAATQDVATHLATLVARTVALPDLVTEQITTETTFRDDLALQSIDLITLGGALQDHYGEHVNFAEFVAELEPAALRDLTVGQLAEHIVCCLRRK